MVKHGYKKTELGEIPQEWELKTYRDITEIVRGASPRPKGDPRYYGGDIPRLMISDVTRDGKYVTPMKDFLTKEGAEKSRPMKQGDLVISISGTVALPTFLAVDACIHDGFMGFRNICDAVDKEFLYYQILYNRTKMINVATDGGVYVNLTTEIVKEFLVIVPSLSEQRKIVEILSTVDEKIDQTDQLIAKIIELKKGLMQELLTKGIGHTEFKETKIGEIPVEWGIKEINDIATINPDALSNNTLDDLLIRYIDIESVTTGKINSMKQILFKDAPSRARRKVQRNDVIISTVRPYLKAFAIIKTDCDNMVCSTGFAVVRVFEGIVPEYIYQITLSEIFMNQINAKMVGSNYPAVNSSDVKSLLIPLPPFSEQLKIADILSSFDEQNTHYESEKKLLQKLKQGLMQQLLTGKIRVTV